MPDNVAKYLGPMNASIIALVIGTVASHSIPITAPNKIATVADGGERTNMVIVKDLIKYIDARGIGFLTLVPSQPKHSVPMMFVTPIIARDQPATSADMPLNIKSAGRCKAINVT